MKVKRHQEGGLTRHGSSSFHAGEELLFDDSPSVGGSLVGVEAGEPGKLLDVDLELSAHARYTRRRRDCCTSGGPDFRQRQASFRTISSFSVKVTFCSVFSWVDSLSDMLNDRSSLCVE